MRTAPLPPASSRSSVAAAALVTARAKSQDTSISKLSSHRTLFKRPRTHATMAILPTSAPGTPNGATSFTQSPKPVSARLPLIFRRLHRFQQMDFELAAWQLTYLCLAPKRVYRNVYFHKQTKNTWARDDPAILVLIAACLIVSAVAWSIVWYYSPWEAIRLAFLMILRDFLFVGLVVATIIWFISNTFLLSPPSHANPADTSVEWAYAFDLFLVPIVLKENWVCLWVGNTLYLAGFAQYMYGVYLGLNALPFLVRTELLLSPLLPLFVGYIVSLLGFNVAKNVLAVYFA